MCGIIAGFNIGTNKEPVNDFIINQMQDQINRGKEGFGLIFIDDKNKVKVERSTELTKTLVDLHFNKSKIIIAHHRQPTSSANKLSQTHPIEINNKSLKYKYLFIHNGIVSNADERKEKHEKLGFEYTTERSFKRWKTDTEFEKEFNDSESLAIDTVRFIEGKTDEIKSSGSLAFIAVQIEKKTDKANKIYYGRTKNPLNLSKTRDKIRLSSEGEGSEIKEKQLYSFNLEDFKIKKQKLEITEYYYTTTNKYSKTDDDEIGYNVDRTNSIKTNAITTYDKKEKKYPGKLTEYDIGQLLEKAIETNIEIMEESIVEFKETLENEELLYKTDFEELIKDTVATIILEMRGAVLNAKQDYENEITKAVIEDAEEKTKEMKKQKEEAEEAAEIEKMEKELKDKTEMDKKFNKINDIDEHYQEITDNSRTTLFQNFPQRYNTR